jgi:hypothetical protein
MNWLIIYDRRGARLLACDSFSDSQRALRHRFGWERYFAGLDVEIVVLGTDSLDTVRRTHSRYFAGVTDEALHSLVLDWP